MANGDRIKNAPRSNRIIWIIFAAGALVLTFIIYSLSEETRVTAEQSMPQILPATGLYSNAHTSYVGENLPPQPPSPELAAEPSPAPQPERPHIPVEVVTPAPPRLNTGAPQTSPSPRVVRKPPSKIYTESLNMRLSALASNPVVNLAGDRAQQQGAQPSVQPNNAAQPDSHGMSPMQIGDLAGAGMNQGASDPDTNATAMAHQDRNDAFITARTDSSAGDYVSSSRTAPKTKFELKAGSVLNGVLVGGINSDTPGTVLGQITENVYDTATGEHLIVPQGSRLIGVYDSHVVFGQNRVIVVWQRLLFPDASSLNIGGMIGSDVSGYAGFKQKVDNHYGRLLGAALFASIFTAAGKIATEDDTDAMGNESAAAEAVMETVTSLGAKLAEKHMNVAPTLRILPGYRFSIVTTKDIAFAEPYRPW